MSRSKVEGRRSKSPGEKTAFSGRFGGCLRFIFGKTSLASSFVFLVAALRGRCGHYIFAL